MKIILFVCVENAGRSQMAEAFFRKYVPTGYEASSAGIRPANKILHTVVQVMNEVGIEIESQKPKELSQQTVDTSEKTVNMGCIDKAECPALFRRDILDWQISDPKGKSIEEVRVIRDQIESKVLNLIQSLQENV